MDISFQQKKDQKPMEGSIAVGHPVFINHDLRCFGGKRGSEKIRDGMEMIAVWYEDR